MSGNGSGNDAMVIACACNDRGYTPSRNKRQVNKGLTDLSVGYMKGLHDYGDDRAGQGVSGG